MSQAERQDGVDGLESRGRNVPNDVPGAGSTFRQLDLIINEQHKLTLWIASWGCRFFAFAQCQLANLPRILTWSAQSTIYAIMSGSLESISPSLIQYPIFPPLRFTLSPKLHHLQYRFREYLFQGPHHLRPGLDLDTPPFFY